jgi:para-nitrobenzyl esterase
MHDMKMMMVGMPWFGSLDEEGLRKVAAGNFGERGDTILAEYRREDPAGSPTDLASQMVTDRVMWAGAIRWAERRAESAGAPAYVYRFDLESPAMQGILGATHGGDIAFAMGNYATSVMAGDRAENAQLGKIMTDTWVQFAASGDPNNAAIPTWKGYGPPDRQTLLFDVPTRVVSDPRSAIRKLIIDAAERTAE